MWFGSKFCGTWRWLGMVSINRSRLFECKLIFITSLSRNIIFKIKIAIKMYFAMSSTCIYCVIDVYQCIWLNLCICFSPLPFLLLQLFTFPVLQQFGLLFRERLESIGLSTAEITTIINLNPCITSCSGEQHNKNKIDIITPESLTRSALVISSPCHSSNVNSNVYL